MIGIAAAAVATMNGVQVMAALNENVDVAALAGLRPGMPISKVEEAMGSAWKPPAPHKGGKIDLLENSRGFVVWIDRHAQLQSSFPAPGRRDCDGDEDRPGARRHAVP
ncbi:hypothetical protein ABCW43_16310 [Neorhizobium sp. IRAMC:178]|uniref:DUF7256 domain-containing protein n=1 Tax=Neorhizobium tunisiense TaxID=3144793 RepID=UPI0031F626AF